MRTVHITTTETNHRDSRESGVRHLVAGRCEVLTAVLLRIQVFWDHTSYRWVRGSGGVSVGCTAFMFRVKQYNKRLLGLLDPKDKVRFEKSATIYPTTKYKKLKDFSSTLP
jgi:hypothetical protein